MGNRFKYLLSVVAFIVYLCHNVAAQKNQYAAWSEPLFQDNVAEFDAKRGRIEFSPYFSAYPSDYGWEREAGWQVETMLTKKLGLQTGFYTTWAAKADKATKNMTNQLEVGLQYTFCDCGKKAWAVGLDLLSPDGTGRGQKQTMGWALQPNFIYGRRWQGGFDSQWRLTPSFEYFEKNWQIGGTVQGAFFWQNDWVSLGIELGGGKTTQPLVFAAPQVGGYLGAFSVWLGWWQPAYFSSEKPTGYFNFTLTYNWDKETF